MKRKQKSASRRRGEILPIDSYSLMGDPGAHMGRSDARRVKDLKC